MKKTWIALSAVVLVAAAIIAYNYATPDRPVSSANQTSSAGITPPQPPPAEPQAPPQANNGFPFNDTSMLKPPAGAKVAIYEFEDMECPACAYAFPIVHATAAQYKIPLVRRDYPWSFHPWSFDAAVTARYLQDTQSPRLADDFRRDVFAGQNSIANKDDLAAFTRAWFRSRNVTLPFVMDASGSCRNEVESDRALGDRLGVHGTPCIFVVTQTRWVAVPYANIRQLGRYVSDAIAQTGSPSAASLAIPTPSDPRAAILRAAPARS